MFLKKMKSNIMELQLDLNKKYTFADYLQWLDDKRREIINGFVKMMTPAPNLLHQQIAYELISVFSKFPQKTINNCKIFFAPTEVAIAF